MRKEQLLALKCLIFHMAAIGLSPKTAAGRSFRLQYRPTTYFVAGINISNGKEM